ncbi:MAG: radical SAM protein [Myxococcota bacterium]
MTTQTQVSELDLREGDVPWIGPHGQCMERLELHLTYTCPERCVFCSEEHRMRAYREFPVTWGRVATILRTHAERGIKAVHLTGGEPTIYPRFVEVLELAKKLGMRTSVGTIGTMLRRPDFAEKALPYLDEALFSLHGPNASVHDKLTGREGSFAQVTEALSLCKSIKPSFSAFVNTVITNDNIHLLPDTVALAAELGATLIVISNTTPEGLGEDRYEQLAVPLSVLAKTLPEVPPKAGDAIVRFFGVPMCLLGEHSTLSNDLHWDPRVTVEWQTAPGKVAFTGIYSWAPDRRRVHTNQCTKCNLKQVCSGVFDKYVDLWPTDALTPQGEDSSHTLAGERP